jgi:hypothetical protein
MTLASDNAPADSNTDSEPLVHTPAEAAKRIGIVTERWLRRKAGERRIPCTRMGRAIGFTDEDIQAIIEQFRRPIPNRVKRR